MQPQSWGTGYGAEVAKKASTRSDYVVEKLLEAAQVIHRLVTRKRVVRELQQ